MNVSSFGNSGASSGLGHMGLPVQPRRKSVFVIGGARSGKSAFALKLAESIGGNRIYVATAEALDGEMEERIGRHRKERSASWETVEEPLDIAGRLSGASTGSVVLIDCLTLWVNNLVSSGLDDDKVVEEARRLSEAIKGARSSVIAVSNELGLGIVPENSLARRFRDLSGIVNREAAGACGEVYFVAAGIPLKMK